MGTSQRNTIKFDSAEEQLAARRESLYKQFECVIRSITEQHKYCSLCFYFNPGEEEVSSELKIETNIDLDILYEVIGLFLGRLSKTDSFRHIKELCSLMDGFYAGLDGTDVEG
jgi:hypothetical protein